MKNMILHLELYWARSNYLSSWVVQMMALFQIPNVEQQVKCISFMMPRLSSSEMNELRKKLWHFANVLIADAPIQGAVEMASDTVPENHNQEESMSRDTQEETHVANDETDRTVTPPITEIESVANIFRDATQMSDAAIQTLHFRLFQELKRRSGMDRLPSFTLKHDRGEMTCIPVPNHKSDDAFKAYQRKTPYLEHMCTAVGGGHCDIGAQRMLSHFACHHEKSFIEVGQERGLAVSSVMDEVALGAMMDDNNLKLCSCLEF
jgi:hypothetical protein